MLFSSVCFIPTVDVSCLIDGGGEEPESVFLDFLDFPQTQANVACFCLRGGLSQISLPCTNPEYAVTHGKELAQSTDFPQSGAFKLPGMFAIGLLKCVKSSAAFFLPVCPVSPRSFANSAKDEIRCMLHFFFLGGVVNFLILVHLFTL